MGSRRLGSAVMITIVTALALVGVSRSPAEGQGPELPQGPPVLLGGGKAVGHGFSTAATASIDFDRFVCTFTVPAVPVEYTDQSVFPWCGVQQDAGVTPSGDDSFGVLQPVLMFGGDCVSGFPNVPFGPGGDPQYAAAPYWYYSAQYVYPQPVGGTDYQCTSGAGFRAEPGDVLVSTMTYDHAADRMIVEIAKQDGSDRSTLTVDHPWDDPTRSWNEFADQFILEVAIEVWNVAGPSGWPASPAVWPVAMVYEGRQPSLFVMIPWDNGQPALTCDPSVMSAARATTTCRYDLGALQPATTTTTSTSTTVAPAALVTPAFTG